MIFIYSFIGAVTGIKPGIFSITLNTRFDLNGGFIGLTEWIYNLDHQQSFVTLAMRDMLTNAKSYDEAVKYFSEIPLLAPCYYILAGPKSGQVRKICFFRNKHFIYILFMNRALLLPDHVKNLLISKH